MYDRLKFLAQILLPVLGTLYFALAGVLSLPAAEEVVGTIVALDALLGLGLKLASLRYQGSAGGSIVVTEVGDKKVFSLELEDDPELLETRDAVTFKVTHG